MNYNLPYVGFGRIPVGARWKPGDSKKKRRENDDLEYDESDFQYQEMMKKWEADNVSEIDSADEVNSSDGEEESKQETVESSKVP